MQYRLSAADLSAVTLSEDDAVTNVLQNVKMILSTRKGEIPMMRDFGLSMDFLDRPIPAAKALLLQEISEAVEQFEPRATVVDISFDAGASTDGVLRPVVTVEVSA